MFARLFLCEKKKKTITYRNANCAIVSHKIMYGRVKYAENLIRKLSVQKDDITFTRHL